MPISFTSPDTEMWIEAHQHANPPLFCSGLHGKPYGAHSVKASVKLFFDDGTPANGFMCDPCAAAAIAEFKGKLKEDWYAMPALQAMGIEYAASLEH